MSVMTVLGPIEADQLGIVLPHEHCFLDLRHQFVKPQEMSKKVLAEQKVSMQNLSALRVNIYKT